MEMNEEGLPQPGYRESKRRASQSKSSKTKEETPPEEQNNLPKELPKEEEAEAKKRGRKMKATAGTSVEPKNTEKEPTPDKKQKRPPKAQTTEESQSATTPLEKKEKKNKKEQPQEPEKKPKDAKPSKDKSDDKESSLTDIVAEYFKKTNRPYSLINLFDNLHGKYKKAQLEAALARLVKDGVLRQKEFGKNIIWWQNQHLIKVDEATMNFEKNRYTQLKSEADAAKLTVNELKATLAATEKQPTTQQLKEQLEELDKRLLTLDDEYNQYQSNDIELVSEQEIAKWEQEIEEVRKIKRKRMLIFNSIVSVLTQEGTTKQELFEKAGIEM